MRELPTGTFTLLSTDVKGLTHLLQKLGDRYARLLEECRSLLYAEFGQRNCHEVDMQGDASFVAFTGANGAVSAAVAAQHSLTSRVFPT